VDSILNSAGVDKLLVLVEESTRATANAPTRFVEPARGTLDLAKARRQHIVFGRRGSGKTSLLRKAIADLTLDRRPVAFVDLESFKGHSYPDVLLSVLISTFRSLNEWLNTGGINPATKRKWWQRLVGANPRRPPLNRIAVSDIEKRLAAQIKALEEQLHATDSAAVEARVTDERSTAATGGVELGAAAGPLKASINAIGSSGSKVVVERRESFTEKKVDFLHRHIIDYQEMFDTIVSGAGGDVFIFLDDLYHIRRSDQPLVVDYFHRIAKGRGVWLKVGTIRHRTEWYRHGDPPIGMKLGDDCNEIDLDITLEKFSLAKRFLFQILDNLITDACLTSHKKILAEGGIERLVLASGGVARDFLTIFKRSVDVARERLQSGGTSRGPMIGAEDVNNAAGEHDASKREELKRDTADERDKVESAFAGVRDFCLDKKANCVLIERDLQTPGTRLIGELVDLRLLHLVASRLTVSGKPGKLYSGFMLDVSQYTGERKRRELEIIRFWEKMDRLRRAGLIYDPEANVSQAVATAGGTV